MFNYSTKITNLPENFAFSELTTGSCENGEWSHWQTRDRPSGNCDCEQIHHLYEDYGHDFYGTGLCQYPMAAEARHSAPGRPERIILTGSVQ